MIDVLYFAWLRERIGTNRERVETSAATVAELVAEHAPTRVLRIGVQDRFSKACGTYEYLLQEHGLDARCVTQRIGQFLQASS
jgi:molybdopterin converting factor small subunit